MITRISECPNCGQTCSQLSIGAGAIDGEAVLRLHCINCGRSHTVPAQPGDVAIVVVRDSPHQGVERGDEPVEVEHNAE